MSSLIRIQRLAGEVTGILNVSPTAAALLEALPCESSAQTWGEEVYFSVPVDTDLEPDDQQVVPPGTLCFWVEGSSLAIPYGRTPISEGDECRLVTAVNILGQLDGNPRVLDSVRDGELITVEKIVV